MEDQGSNGHFGLRQQAGCLWQSTVALYCTHLCCEHIHSTFLKSSSYPITVYKGLIGMKKKLQSDNMHTMANLCLYNYIQYSLAINVESSDDLGLLPQLQWSNWHSLLSSRHHCKACQVPEEGLHGCCILETIWLYQKWQSVTTFNVRGLLKPDIPDEWLGFTTCIG